MITNKQTLALIEIGIVIFAGFLANYVMKAAGFNVFALPHLVFLFVAIFFRSVVSNWKLVDYGFCGGILYQIKLGILVWLIAQTYYSVLHIFAPLFPEVAKKSATILKITTLGALKENILWVALFKAGILETLRYFSYAEGVLMGAFGDPLGALMTFVYFGSAHMGIMNLIVLPVSFLFVYFYRAYRLTVPLIIFHALGDTGGFIQNYLSYHRMYAYNFIVFFFLLAALILCRNEIIVILRKVGSAFSQDVKWLKNHKTRAIILSFVLPMWLHLLLFLER